MNNDNFLIEDSDLDLAKIVCNEIKESTVRNRAVANVLAADIAKKYFTEVEVDTDSGLHKVAFVLNDIDIADVYVNDCYIDVRLYFDAEELCVPMSHFEKGILPIAYMFIKVNSDLSGGMVTGFVTPGSIDTTSGNNGYYIISEDNLMSFYDIEPLLISDNTDNEIINFDSLIFDYLDGRLEDVTSFYRTLIRSKYYRNVLKNAANVQNIFKYVSLVSPQDSNLIEEQSYSDLDTDANDISVLEEVGGGVSELVAEQSDSTLDNVLDDGEPVFFDELENMDEIGFEPEKHQEMELDLSEENGFEQFDSDEIIPIEEVSLLEESLVENETEFVVTDDLVVETSSEENLEFDEDFESNSDDLMVSETEAKEILLDPNEDDFNIETFSTSVTPSIKDIEGNSQDQAVLEQELEDLLAVTEEDADENISEEIIQNEETLTEATDNNYENASQIEDLFGKEDEENEVLNESFIEPGKKQGSKILPFLGIVVVVAGLGYWGYTKYSNALPLKDAIPESSQKVSQTERNTSNSADPMPIETVENVKIEQPSNEGNAISIPAIEQNLDASILVSNLSVNWEVPSNYVTNNTAKRYFTKIGKIIQLNLKTELLLLSKPPITNKIMVELEFNKKNNKFDVKGITVSSGEKNVDDIILQTVKRALNMNLKVNLSSFASGNANPVLIIRL